jgi:DNA-binding SARP family transcriptional activator
MAKALSVALLGGFTLIVDDEVVDLPAGSQRLIALLALGGRTSRSRLAGTLWPETFENRALASLRTGIWRINHVTDGLVRVRGVTVELGPFVDVDVRRLVRAGLAALRDGSRGAPDDVDPIPDGGELLPDWEDEWLLADRERLRQLRLHVLEAAAGRLSRAGQYGLALESALTALRADPLRESAHRTIIGIHLAEGNVAEARRALDACHLTLRREVGVEPSQAVRCMVERAGGRADFNRSRGREMISWSC